MPASAMEAHISGSQRLVGFEQHFAGLAIHQLADGDGAFEVHHADFHLIHLGLDQILVQGFGDALVRSDQHFVGLGRLHFARKLAVDQAFGGVPEKIAAAQRDALDLIEGAQDVFIRLHSQGAQEDGAQELALAVDAHV